MSAPSPGVPDIIPICFEKEVDMLVALLTALKAGAGYTAVHSDHPADRIDNILQMIQAPVVLCNGRAGNENVYDVARRRGALVITFRELLHTYGSKDKAVLLNRPKAAQSTLSFACILFTSGSTGRPKGVMMQHLEKKLRAQLQNQLPSYMVPAVIKVLDDMPISSNGKIDRRALSQIIDTAEMEPAKAGVTFVAPRDN